MDITIKNQENNYFLATNRITKNQELKMPLIPCLKAVQNQQGALIVAIYLPTKYSLAPSQGGFFIA